jgi:hypothetical protein
VRRFAGPGASGSSSLLAVSPRIPRKAPVDPGAALSELPRGSGYRRRRARILGRGLDVALSARQAALGLGRELDQMGRGMPRRRVLVMALYGPEGVEPTAAAVEELRSSRHDVTVALGALGGVAPALGRDTARAGMEGGKFANLNRLAEEAAPLAADWILLLDDDIRLSRHFLDRLVCAAESFGLAMAQPALSRASHGAWEINRRRPALVRETQFVEIGPALLISREAWRELTPFPEAGMGWGLCLHWGAVARRRGWKLGVVDAVPVRNESRPPAASYDRTEAKAAAAELLASREHITHAEAESVLVSHGGLP